MNNERITELKNLKNEIDSVNKLLKMYIQEAERISLGMKKTCNNLEKQIGEEERK